MSTTPRREVDPVALHAFSSAWTLAGAAVVEKGVMVEALQAVSLLVSENAPRAASLVEDDQ